MEKQCQHTCVVILFLIKAGSKYVIYPLNFYFLLYMKENQKVHQNISILISLYRIGDTK